MRLSGFLTKQQVEKTHRTALQILDEIGVRVEDERLRDRLTTVGGVIAGESVRFSGDIVESLIQTAPKQPPRTGAARVSLGCGVYHSAYLDPHSGELIPFDESLLARYFGLAERLGISRGVLGLPFVPEDIPAECLPLAEKLYAWKYGASPGGTVQAASLCEPLMEMFEVHSASTGKPLEEVFCAVGFMISPLKLASQECRQLIFFADHGLRMGIGHMPSQGGSAPVTFAGALALALAEQIFLFLLRKSLWDDTHFYLGASSSVIDMHTGASLYGRPEKLRMNLAFADLAEYCGCHCSGHAGCTDAHNPSYEAGVQKAAGALITALATGHAYIEARLLAVDDVCSPVQMALDHDLAMSLETLFAEADEEYAFEEILAAGIGGCHLGTHFTAEHFRSLFEPKTWSNQSLSARRASGMKADIDKARDIVADFERDFRPESRISDEEERELKTIIETAAKA